MRMKGLMALALAGGLTLTVTGCLPGSVNTLASAASGALKFSNEQWSTLTGGEIKAIFDIIKTGGAIEGFEDLDVDIPLDLDMSQEQADAIAQFLSDNSINNATDAENVLEQAFEDPGSVSIPDGMIEMFLGEFDDEDGNLGSAVTKLANGQISEWTAAEVQSLATNISEVNPDVETIELTDDQAAAIVEFIQLNNINTPAEWDAAVNQPGGPTVPEGAEELFEGLSL